MSRPPFTLEGYRTTIRHLLGRGYAPRSFHDVEPSAPHLVLRHDIDQSIVIAREMADAETAEGWRSTWFVLVRTEMYNPFSRTASGNLRAMITAGHEIGLHLDASLYGNDEERNAGACVECRMLEDITGQPVRIVSFHRPAPELVGSDLAVSGRAHTYMPRFVREIGYCSDSRGEWRNGHPWEHAAVSQGRALQLLTHAVWWVGCEGRDAVGRLEDLMAAKVREINVELAANNAVWSVDRT